MIWEYTFPEARVIEAGLEYSEDDSEGETEYIVLRLAGRLSTLLQHQEEFTTRITEDGPFEKCLDPVALWICRESRMYTMTQYTTMRHLVLTTCSFYFNPSRDVLWFTMDATDELELLPQMQLYGKQLDNIEIAFVEELWWDEKTPEKYSSSFLDFLGGLRIILLLLDLDVPTEIDNQQHADELRIAHQELLSRRKWTIKYIDLISRFY
jgi:2EXR family